MRFATLALGGSEQVCVRRSDGLWARLDMTPGGMTGDLSALVHLEPTADQLATLQEQAERLDDHHLVAPEAADYRPPYRRARKIWGIGLNYDDHAADLNESSPPMPASFIKGDHTIIGPGDEIVIPHQSQRTTAEAELGLIMGSTARNVDTVSALDSVFGVCVILDQTAEDILELNPRYLTRAKNFPTFFSFGPEVVTLDEFLAEQDLADVVVATVIGGVEGRRNTVRRMMHSPADLISFHSEVMPLYPCDIISTGTPGASVLEAGTTVEARVSGLLPLTNTARDEQAPQSD